jgi:DNA-directed RNA polymerase specialized sigma24 family protein
LPLFRFAYRMTGSAADAEDIVQECFPGAIASGMFI